MPRFKSVASPDYPDGIRVLFTAAEEAEADAADIVHAAAQIDLAWSRMRAQRDQRLQRFDSLVMRHQEQIALGISATLTPAQYLRALTYRQVLRDLPALTVDPANPVWPAVPV